MIDSAVYLVDHLHEVPVHVLFCIEDPRPRRPPFRPGHGLWLNSAGGLVVYAAARARGLGCCWTTVHLKQADEAATLLNIPASVNQCVLLPVAYYTWYGFLKLLGVFQPQN